MTLSISGGAAAALAAAIVLASVAAPPGPARADAFVALPASEGAEAPSNNNFANALFVPVTTGQRAIVAFTNAGATREPGEPRHRAFADTTTVWFRFHAPDTGTMIVDTHGSQFDTVLAVYTGAALGSLTRVRLNDDFNRANPYLFRTSRLVFEVTDGTTYHVVLAGKNAAEGTYRLWFTPPGTTYY